MKDTKQKIGLQAWRCILLSSLLLILAVVVLKVVDPASNGDFLYIWLAPALLIGSWVMAIRFLLFDTWGRWIWAAFMVAAALCAFNLGDGGVAFAVFMTLIFLSIRQYRPWRHISARNRAWGFGAGLIVVAGCIVVWGFWSAVETSEIAGHWISGGVWALCSIIGFWIYSLLHLVMNMRLHFMRIRPKLGVSAFLIGFVPIVLVLLLGLAALWFGLGGARAQRGLSTLESWRTMTSRGYDFSGAIFDTSFVWSVADSSALAAPIVDLPQTEVVEIEPPTDIPLLVQAWVAQRSGIVALGNPVKPDSTGWFLADKQLWLMHWQGLDGPDISVQGWALGEAALSRLSADLHAGVRVSPTGLSSSDGGIIIGDSDEETDDLFQGAQYYFRGSEGHEEFWARSLYFGGGFLKVGRVAKTGWSEYPTMVQVRVSVKDLMDDFIGGRDNLNVGAVLFLGVLAVLFLIIEIFAIFFSTRITEGIISAVHVLHKRTKTLTAGDFDSRIDIPNEDEFGDLASSFNEMAAAVKVGQEAALANQMLTQEMDTARSIQERLLPASDPQLPSFEITGASIPSREVGGDYFDFLVQSDNSVGVAIGDVSGKGMPAALLMANLQASLQGQVIHPSSVSEVVSRVNDLLVRSTDPHMFATFFYGLIDTRMGTFTSTNAGHNPPLVLRNSGEIDLLTKGGLLLGMLDNRDYKQETIELEPGEVVVLYTDGITEAVGPGVEEDDPEAMFGEEALVEVLQNNGHLPAVGIKEAILDAVREHTVGMRQSDDITLVVVRRQN